MDESPRNIRVRVDIELRMPDVKRQEPKPEGEARLPENIPYESYAAFIRRQLADESHEEIVDLIHGILEAGDPDDAYDMVVIVDDVKWVGEDS